MTTVREVLDQSALALTPVALPRPEAGVRWVATSELTDPTPFLEGGEILLSTGLDAGSWDAEWDGYVERLAEAGVVAVGFGTGLTHAKVPPPLTAACTRHLVNLFEVPRQTTFVAVSRAVARLLDQHEEAAARRALAMQRELTQAARGRDSRAGLVRRLGKVVGGRAFLLTPKGELIGPAGARIADDHLADVRAEVERIRRQGLRASAVASSVHGTTVVQPIGLRGAPDGYLALLVPDRLSEGQKNAVTTATALLSLEADSRQERRDTLRRLRARAVELVTQDDPRTAALVMAAATGQSPEAVDLPRRVRILRGTGSLDQLEQCLRLAEGRQHGRDKAVLVATVSGELCLVAEAARSRSWASLLLDRGLRVGLGSAVPLDSAGRSYAAAGHALAQATRSSPLVAWDDVVNEGVLSLLDHDLARAFADEFLGRLRQRTNHQELLETLRSFLRNHGRAGSVSEELGVHRNTVRNRILEIEEAVGRSLAEPQARVSAWIALQVEATDTLRE